MFRVDEGVVTLQRQGAGLYFDRFRPRYRPEDLTGGFGYSTLRAFVDSRESRDIHFGDGIDQGGWRDVTPIRIED